PITVPTLSEHLCSLFSFYGVFIVKKKETTRLFPQTPTLVLAFTIQILIAGAVCAQTSPSTAAPTPVVASSAPAVAAAIEADSTPRRMEHARALAAAHQLTAAATELESVRASVSDEVVRNNSSLMLMGIYLEDGNYARAESLLEETFKGRSSKNEASVRTYFALAGQAVNGARAHIGRYRTFGIDVSSSSLPAEAVTDLDRLRSLLERMSAQGKALIKENAQANDAFALLEDISGIRTALARDTNDRAKWDTEHSAARARLATLPTEIAANNGVLAAAGVGESETRNGHPTAPSPGAVANTNPPAVAAAVTTLPNNVVTNETPKTRNGNSPLEVGSLTDKATSKVAPVYPQLAKNGGVAGLVRVKVVVDESGSVASIVWAEGPMLLRQAATEALRQWKFQPVLVDGKPVRATGYVDFGFLR
ncbi:MAG: energy transducer TonB, partial [Acidobacteriota bacterium]|nr:energy transducer TonB [Acidobacteriota bacterium]